MSVYEAAWTIHELGEAVAAALESGYRGPANGQVRPVPDERTIRYYTTLGLIDRPLGMRGRTALYGWRHLAQIVAIKRLQEEGKALAEIQAALAGASEARLAQIAGMGDASEQGKARGERRQRAAGAAAAQRDRFWGEVPEPSGKADEEGVAESAAPGREAAARAGEGGAARTITAVELAPGVTLLVDGVRQLDRAGAAALRRAAAELLKELERLE